MPEFITRIVDFGPCECCAASSSSSSDLSSSSSGLITGWVCPPPNNGYICTGWICTGHVCVKECQCPDGAPPFSIIGAAGPHIGEEAFDGTSSPIYHADVNGYVTGSVSVACSNGDWILSANICFFFAPDCVGSRFYQTIILCKDTDADGLPPAGTITLERLIDTGYESPSDCGDQIGPVTVTINRQ